MRSKVTTVLEVAGGIAIIAGVVLLVGPGFGLIAAGVLAIAGSWLVSR